MFPSNASLESTPPSFGGHVSNSSDSAPGFNFGPSTAGQAAIPLMFSNRSNQSNTGGGFRFSNAAPSSSRSSSSSSAGSRFSAASPAAVARSSSASLATQGRSRLTIPANRRGGGGGDGGGGGSSFNFSNGSSGSSSGSSIIQTPLSTPTGTLAPGTRVQCRWRSLRGRLYNATVRESMDRTGSVGFGLEEGSTFFGGIVSGGLSTAAVTYVIDYQDGDSEHNVPANRITVHPWTDESMGGFGVTHSELSEIAQLARAADVRIANASSFGSSGSAATTSNSSGGMNWKRNLISFYLAYAPEKNIESTITRMLNKFRGSEINMFQKLFRKYRVPISDQPPFLGSAVIPKPSALITAAMAVQRREELSTEETKLFRLQQTLADTEALLPSAQSAKLWAEVEALAKRLSGTTLQITEAEKKVTEARARVDAADAFAAATAEEEAQAAVVVAEASGGTKVDEDEDEDEDEGKNCMICMDALANCAILPCGHICGCLGCMQDVRTRKCPICRGPVTTVQEVFFSALQPPKKKEFKGLRQASAQLAAPFVSYGITRVQARSALNESNGDMGEAGKKLLEMAIQSSTARGAVASSSSSSSSTLLGRETNVRERCQALSGKWQMEDPEKLTTFSYEFHVVNAAMGSFKGRQTKYNGGEWSVPLTGVVETDGGIRWTVGDITCRGTYIVKDGEVPCIVDGTYGDADRQIGQFRGTRLNELTSDGQSRGLTTWTTPWLCPTCDVENLVTEMECPCCGHLRVA